ncbi:MAG: hypothetical protein HY805_08310 [Nitrospirae bacterium]|nr:hypothetical protein [Nitrospirota bacterium]
MLTGFESAQRQHVKDTISKIAGRPAEGLLKILLLEGPRKFSENEINDWLKRQQSRANTHSSYLDELITLDLVIKMPISEGPKLLRYPNISVNEAYRKYLEELLWEKL